MKSKSFIIFLISILSILAILIIVFLVFALKTGFNFNFKFSSGLSNNLVIDKIFDNEFNNINIKTDASDIEIKNSEDNKIKVLVYSDIEKSSTNVIDDTLEIKSNNKKCDFFCFNVKKSKVLVYLPSDYDKNITIKNNYGDVSTESFNSANMKLSLNYGDVKVDSVKDIDVNSSYGDVKIGKVNNYLEISDSYGDVRIEEVNIKSDSKISCSFGDIRIEDTNEIYIDAKTSLGDVKINNNYNKSDITLKIKNSMGDIKVKN